MINDTNRDIHHFETDDLGNTKRVVLNTDEPLGLVDEDVEARLEALENRLNALTGFVGNDVIQIPHGGTGADNVGDAASNIVSNLQFLDSSDPFQYGLVAQRMSGGSSVGGVYRVGQDMFADKIGALKASNNLSDVVNGLASLQNLYEDVPDLTHPGEVPIKDWIDAMYVILNGGRVQIGDNDYTASSSRYSLLNLVNNYLSEYFLRKDNDLSDVNGVPSAVKNLFDGLSNLATSLLSDRTEVIVNNSLFPALNGKITLGDLFQYYLADKINNYYGFTNNGNVEFSGNAATADLSKATEVSHHYTHYVDPSVVAKSKLTLHTKEIEYTYPQSLTNLSMRLVMNDAVTTGSVPILVGASAKVTDGSGLIRITNVRTECNNNTYEAYFTYDVTSVEESITFTLLILYYVMEDLP